MQFWCFMLLDLTPSYFADCESDMKVLIAQAAMVAQNFQTCFWQILTTCLYCIVTQLMRWVRPWFNSFFLGKKSELCCLFRKLPSGAACLCDRKTNWCIKMWQAARHSLSPAPCCGFVQMLYFLCSWRRSIRLVSPLHQPVGVWLGRCAFVVVVGWKTNHQPFQQSPATDLLLHNAFHLHGAQVRIITTSLFLALACLILWQMCFMPHEATAQRESVRCSCDNVFTHSK